MPKLIVIMINYDKFLKLTSKIILQKILKKKQRRR